MDSTERAKRAANARKQTSKSSSSTNTNTSSYSQASTGAKTITLPKTDENTFGRKDITPTLNSRIDFNVSTQTVSVDLPNLPNYSVDDIADNLFITTPKQITDIRNPGFTEDEKCDKATFEKAKLEYEDAIRYQQLIVWANNYKGEEYKAIASAAKAFTQGLIAKTEIEKVYQQFLKLAKQEQITIQEGIGYIAQSHKTATVQASLPYSLAENESTLENQRIKAQRSFEEAKQSSIEFQDWLASLKGIKDTVTASF